MPGALHVYLSPHLDDAILSCGGLICNQRQTGERVVVMTLCAGQPASNFRSTLAKEYERSWGTPGEGITRRLRENSLVLAAMKVTDWRFDTPDAVYRGIGGTPYYMQREDLYGSPHPSEGKSLPALWGKMIKLLTRREKTVILYAPLAVGGHVDHELVRRTGELLRESGCEVWFYEDYPYAEVLPAGIQSARERFGDCDWISRVEVIDAATKIGMVKGYRSQIGNLFGCENELACRVSEFTAATAASIDHNERLRLKLAPTGWRRRWWRRLFGFHRHAERFWQPERRTKAHFISMQDYPGAVQKGASMADDPQKRMSYWNERLRCHWGPEGVSSVVYGRQFALWRYRVRRLVFRRLVKRLFRRRDSLSVLDVGCGTGFYLGQWQAMGIRTLAGLDISEWAISQLSRAFSEATFYHADIAAPALPLPAGAFDAISAIDVLVHLVDEESYLRALRNLHSALKDGGYLLYSDCFFHGKEKVFEDYWKGRSLDKVAAAMADCGFEVLERVPLSILMSPPTDTGYRHQMEKLWETAMVPVRRSERTGFVVGAMLFPLELLLVSCLRESPAIEIMVCRKC